MSSVPPVRTVHRDPRAQRRRDDQPRVAPAGGQHHVRPPRPVAPGRQPRRRAGGPSAPRRSPAPRRGEERPGRPDPLDALPERRAGQGPPAAEHAGERVEVEVLRRRRSAAAPPASSTSTARGGRPDRRRARRSSPRRRPPRRTARRDPPATPSRYSAGSRTERPSASSPVPADRPPGEERVARSVGDAVLDAADARGGWARQAPSARRCSTPSSRNGERSPSRTSAARAGVASDQEQVHAASIAHDGGVSYTSRRQPIVAAARITEPAPHTRGPRAGSVSADAPLRGPDSPCAILDSRALGTWPRRASRSLCPPNS